MPPSNSLYLLSARFQRGNQKLKSQYYAYYLRMCSSLIAQVEELPPLAFYRSSSVTSNRQILMPRAYNSYYQKDIRK